MATRLGLPGAQRRGRDRLAELLEDAASIVRAFDRWRALGVLDRDVLTRVLRGHTAREFEVRRFPGTARPPSGWIRTADRALWDCGSRQPLEAKDGPLTTSPTPSPTPLREKAAPTNTAQRGDRWSGAFRRTPGRSCPSGSGRPTTAWLNRHDWPPSW
ncbi:hypothetical protein AB0M83_11500 [Amycolatopsis sp. NPDC051106]|uniref:hypothetical protein n=1 Tax=unclassified Amycolatopsis TaxID=2618356 RepID=UPI00342DC33C